MDALALAAAARGRRTGGEEARFAIGEPVTNVTVAALIIA
jgi:hypothetical protein